jgi:hypothetical protein
VQLAQPQRGAGAGLQRGAQRRHVVCGSRTAG